MKNLGLIGISLAAAAVTLGIVVACGGGGTTPSITCTTDADCGGVSEICHPDAKVCVQTCTGGEDCPDASKNCAAISATNTTKICKCTTTPLCQGGAAGADSICSSTFSVCTPKCTSNLDCGSGLDCDTASGECKPGATDAGTGDAGTCSWSTCSPANWTAGAQTCTATGCAAGASCSGTGQTACSYGEYCNGGACSFPNYPTQAACQNFYSGSHASGPTWNPTSSTGPVIYEVSEIAHGAGQTGNFTHCTATDKNGDPVTEWDIRVRAYRTDMDWPATRAGLSGFKYVTTSGSDTDIVSNTLLIPNTGYNKNPSNARDAEFQVYLCPANAANDFQPGFYFVGGNEACRQF